MKIWKDKTGFVGKTHSHQEGNNTTRFDYWLQTLIESITTSKDVSARRHYALLTRLDTHTSDTARIVWWGRKTSPLVFKQARRLTTLYRVEHRGFKIKSYKGILSCFVLKPYVDAI